VFEIYFKILKSLGLKVMAKLTKIIRNLSKYICYKLANIDFNTNFPHIHLLGNLFNNHLYIIIKQYQITWALLSPDSPAITFFDNKKTWQRYYADSDAVIYLLDPNK
jgi:hypothetical protein